MDNTAMTDNLKPCPWCGAVPEIVRLDSDMYWVACTNNDCPTQPDTKFMCSKDEAAAAWNVRTNTIDTIEAENSFLRELVRATWRCIHKGVSCSDCLLAMRELGVEVDG